MKDDPIARVLDDLLKFDDILACMVGRRGMIDSILPSDGTDSFKPEINEIWDIVRRTMDSQLSVISEFSRVGLKRLNFQLQDYDVMFYVIPDTENALVAIVRALANRGLIAVEMENARREIIRIREEEEKKLFATT
ncbi:MAG: hypothetical protein DRN24_06695 [Thermoplasmata archaeon]|nr:MAG: hypothetical protein DRN24_06695 [Thermoplasmata archaeon]